MHPVMIRKKLPNLSSNLRLRIRDKINPIKKMPPVTATQMINAFVVLPVFAFFGLFGKIGESFSA